MTGKKSRKKVIIPIVVVVLLLGAGAAAYYGVTTGFFGGSGAPNKNLSTGDAYKEDFRKAESKVTDLITKGDEQSIKEADEIIDSEVKAANESGNDAYIVDANLAKSTLLTKTDRAQQVIDEVLPSLEEKYKDNEMYRNGVYLHFVLAYRELGDDDTADEYQSQMTGIGGN